MNIAMFTNAYIPVIGGVERSIATFSEDIRQAGHRVLIVTLEVPGAKESSENVFRLPAVTEVGGTEFSVKLPVPSGLKKRLDAFAPDIIHSHHPFMLGDTALRVSRTRDLSLVFTHHTLYERYAYRFRQNSHTLEHIAMFIATEYANLSHLVLAPTGSIQKLIRKRGVNTPIQVIPTGVDGTIFGNGRRKKFRQEHGIPPEAFVLGYLGRVVEAKNMDFVACAAVRFLAQNPAAWFLVAGDGEAAEAVRQRVQEGGVAERVVMTGSLRGASVADAYAAMDLFAFASKTETQGIVLIESLCAGVPVVALDASGTRDIVQDDKSGIILDGDATPEAFSDRLCELKDHPDVLQRLSEGARQRGRTFDRKHCAEKLLAAYEQLKDQQPPPSQDDDAWESLQDRFQAEWSLIKQKFSVISAALASETPGNSQEGTAAEQAQ